MTEQEDIMMKLYSKLSEGLGVSKNAVPGQNFLALCSPGFFLDPKEKADTDTGARYRWSRILDKVPHANWQYGTTNALVPDVYKVILKEKELPPVSLGEQQKKALAAARAVVQDKHGNPTKKFKKFKELRQRYREVLTKFENARLDFQNAGTRIPPRLAEEVSDARSEWQTFGFKSEVEAAQATVANLQQLNPNIWWKELEDAFQNSMEEFEGRSFDPTSTYPAYSALVGGEGSWTKFSFSQADLAKQATSSTVEASGSMSGAWGLLSFGGGASYRKHTEETSMDYSSLEIEVEIMRASIERPWLDPLVFRAHSWRFKDASRVISDGGSPVAPGQTESGALMPLLPTGVLVARNLRLKNALSHEDMQLAEEELKVSGSIGWGPFSIGGSYAQSSSSFAQHTSVSAEGIEVHDPQVIGFFCDALPLCPSPNPQLWQQG